MTSAPRRAAAVAVALALLVVPCPARAGDPREDSRAAFLRGVSEAHRDHFTAARDAFLEAYRLFPHPSILLNLGVARMHTGEYVAAEADLSHFLVDDGGASAEDLANARATLAVVRKHLGTLHLRVSPDGAHGTLDGVMLPLTPGAFVDVRAVTGPAELRVEEEGYGTLVRQIVVAHDDNPPLDLQLPRGASGGVSDAPAVYGRPGPPAPRRDLVAWSVLGGAAVAAVVGTVAGVEAISHAHDYNTPGSSQFQDPSTRSEGIAWRTSADVFFATALAAGAVGAYLLFRPRNVQAVVGPTACVVRFEF